MQYKRIIMAGMIMMAAFSSGMLFCSRVQAETFQRTSPTLKKMTPDEPTYGSSQRRQFSSTLLKENETRQVVQEYMRQKRAMDKLSVYDDEEKRTRTLNFLTFQGTPQKRGGAYSYCAMFDDEDTGDKVDVDFILQESYGKPSVREVVIHKINGEAVFEYDENGNRIPIEKEETDEPKPAPAPPPKSRLFSDEYLEKQHLKPPSSSRNP